MRSYVVTRVEEIAAGRSLKILDIGCGSGELLMALTARGHEVHGYDLFPNRTRIEALQQALARSSARAAAGRVVISYSAKEIPFPDRQFDFAYANQVFEHVTHLGSILSECARVLRSDGHLIATFPFATTPFEQHVKLLFAHWIPPGELRRLYLAAAAWIIGGGKNWGDTPREIAAVQDTYLATKTFYRLSNEVIELSRQYFSVVELETERVLDVKLTHWESVGVLRRALAQGWKEWGRPGIRKAAGWLVGHYYNAALHLCGPRADR
jgi:ubiquinone/menaquinone biosynthesis C-methylase UbiE